MKRSAVVALVGMMMAGTVYARDITIGYTYIGAQDVFQNLLTSEFIKAAEEKGVNVRVIDPQNDIERQNSAIDNFITLGVDAIVCNPIDIQGGITGVKAANQAGTPYVALNSEVGGDGNFVYVGSSNYDAGYLQGEYMAKVLPQGAKIVYLRGIEGMDHTINRRKGVEDALLDKRPDIELLAEQTAKYDRAEGMRVMEDWIQAFPVIDGVLAANDQMALGALEALKAAHIDNVLIAGIDGTREAMDRVKDGTFAITVLQDARGQARGALDAALALIAGKTVDKRILIPFQPVTRENVDQHLQ
ncbi:MAG: sugar ABC transporter substrate-binding protein [Desulfopila sp.]